MINREQLGFALSAKFEDFAKLPNATVLGNGEYDRHIYIDNGCDILGVAHMDSVQPFHFYKVGKDYIQCATVDDRIGVYMMLYGLPAIGIKCDVLLTDHEEIGQSTAQFFNSPKDYNWMFQFDRGYDDVVMYQYEDPVLEDELSAAGFLVGDGIFSDISYMDHMGCRGFNMGCGMRKYHNKDAYVHINVLLYQAACFRYFWAANRDRRFEYVPAPRYHVRKSKKSKVSFDLYERGYWDSDDMYVWPGGWKSTHGPDKEEPNEQYASCDYCGTYNRCDEMKHVYGEQALVCGACFHHIEEMYQDDDFDDEKPKKGVKI